MMAQIIIYKQPPGHGWIAYTMVPSLDPRSQVPNAIIFHSKAFDVQTRREINIKALGTGRDLPPQQPPRRMGGAPVHYLG